MLRYGVSLAAASALGGSGVSPAPERIEQSTASPRPPPPNPNIVLILADNVGYGVLSCYNGGILDTPTPRIDKLAA